VISGAHLLCPHQHHGQPPVTKDKQPHQLRAPKGTCSGREKLCGTRTSAAAFCHDARALCWRLLLEFFSFYIFPLGFIFSDLKTLPRKPLSFWRCIYGNVACYVTNRLHFYLQIMKWTTHTSETSCTNIQFYMERFTLEKQVKEKASFPQVDLGI
jgi:hypothetical protein